MIMLSIYFSPQMDYTGLFSLIKGILHHYLSVKVSRVCLTFYYLIENSV